MNTHQALEDIENDKKRAEAKRELMKHGMDVDLLMDNCMILRYSYMNKMIKYIPEKFTDVPPLLDITDDEINDLLINKKLGYASISDLLDNGGNANDAITYIGDRIGDYYTTDKHMQKVWRVDKGSDSLMIRTEVTDDDVRWLLDYDGKMFGCKVIIPILAYVHGIVSKKVHNYECGPKLDDNDYLKTLKESLKLMKKIESGIVTKRLRKYVASMFVLDEVI